MRRKGIVITIGIMIFFGYINCFAQSAKEAVKALQKLQAKVETGISFQDYFRALGDTKFEVDLFLRSVRPESTNEQLLKLAGQIQSAHLDYQSAGSIWDLQITGVSAGVFPSQGIRIKSIENYKWSYPELGYLKRYPLHSDCVFIEDVLRVIWKHAIKNTEEAITIIQAGK
jgi:hypothetical protein